MTMEQAIFGGGCFWSTEAVFQQIRGVKSVESGYAGGTIVNPMYDDVAEGSSGHAEVVRLQFDSDRVSYEDLLEVFFAIHDPTSLNRQGSDIGSQYRSVIFYQSAQQKELAVKAIRNISRLFDLPIVTELVAAPAFYLAEDYHQNYFRLNSHQRYCALVVEPKVAKARELLAHKASMRNTALSKQYPHLAYSGV